MVNGTLVMTLVTTSGLQPRKLIELLVNRWEEQGFLNGPAFVDNLGNEIKPGKYEALLLGILHDHKQWENKLEGDHEKILEGVDIDEVYGVLRSFKWGPSQELRKQVLNHGMWNSWDVGEWWNRPQVENLGGRSKAL
jgi:hypothetical protein